MTLESSVNKWAFDDIPSVQIVCDGGSDSDLSSDDSSSSENEQASTPQKNALGLCAERPGTAKRFSVLPSDEDDVVQERRQEIERSKTTHDCNLAALHLTALPRGLPLSSLTKLNLSENNLTSLPGNAFVGRCGEQLRELDLHSNRLRFLPATLLRLPRLKVLSLNYNQLRSLPFAPKHGERASRKDTTGCNRLILPALQRVSIEFNDLTQFPIEFFEECTQLKEILLSQNEVMLDAPVPYERLLHCSLATRLAQTTPTSSPALSTAPEEVRLRVDNRPRFLRQAEEQQWATTLPWLKLEFHKIYPDRVLDYLFLGSVRTAQTVTVYHDLDIQYILTVGRDLEVKVEPGMQHLVLPINDFPEENMMPLFDEAFAFIDASRAAKKGVLIHCFAGLSRSVTVAAAYIMKKLHMSRDEALALIRQARPAARPNDGFMEGLLEYQAMLYDTSPTSVPNVVSS